MLAILAFCEAAWGPHTLLLRWGKLAMVSKVVEAFESLLAAGLEATKDLARSMLFIVPSCAEHSWKETEYDTCSSASEAAAASLEVVE